MKEKNKFAQEMGRLSHEKRLEKWGGDVYKNNMSEWGKKGAQKRWANHKKNEQNNIVGNTINQ